MRRKRKGISRTFGFFCLLISLAGSPCESRPAQDVTPSYPAEVLQEPGNDDASYMIGPDNFILIRILGESDTQQTFRVDESGFITHPLVGRIKVAAKTVAETERLMEEALKGDYLLNPNVTVLVLEHSRFSILGEVRNPGHYEISGQLRLVEAISMAGGFTPVANQKKVKILRRSEGGEMKLEENVEDVVQGKRQDDVFIQSGDVISVSKSFF